MSRASLPRVLVLAAMSLVLGLSASAAEAQSETSQRPAHPVAPPATPDSSLEGPVVPDVPPGCADAIVDDDGSVESGYGWVPSVVEGIFVQEYSSEEVPSGTLGSVCICWLRIRMDDTIDFDVVLYRDNPAEGMPEKVPYAAFPAQIAGLPPGIPGATYTQVDLGDVQVPEGRFFVGVRWDASVDQFFFACVDRTDGPGPPTRVYFRDDRSPAEWGVSDDTNDPTFDDHRAMLVRPVPGTPPPAPLPVEVPLSRTAAAVLVFALLATGVLALRRI